MQQCHHCHSSVWQGPPQAGRSLYPSRGVALAAPVPAVSTSPMHRRSKPGLFSQKSIKAGVWVEVGTTDQQWGLICVGDTQVLLCYPIQDGQGIVTSWGCLCVPGLLCSLGSWRVLLLSQAGAGAPGALLQCRRVHCPGSSWSPARGSPGPAGGSPRLWHGPPPWGRGIAQGQNCVGPSSLGLPTRLAELCQSLAAGTGAWG